MYTNYKISLVLIVSLIVAFCFNTDFALAKNKITENKPKETIKDKKVKVLDLILQREKELNDRLNDLKTLYTQGLISLNESNAYKDELNELKQFEFIVKERVFNNYETILKDKLKNKIDNLQKEIAPKEILWQEGLIATKDLEEIQEKAALYNYILDFLAEPPPTNIASLNQKSLNVFSFFNQKFPISSTFGFRTDPINLNRKQFHAGIDFAAYLGTPIKAPFNGKVIMVSRNLNSGGGLKIILQHDGFDTAYMHLSEIKVKEGQIIQAGQIIGKVGSTGKRTTGAHLHFEIRLKGIPVNPIRFFSTN